jgi:integrase
MRPINKLTAPFVRQKFNPPGKYADGNNLYLVVSSERARSWVFRYSFRDNEKELGLGSAWDVDLADARLKAGEYRRLLAAKVDPDSNIHPKKVPTFGNVLEEYVRGFASRWSNKKSPHQWRKTKDYVGPFWEMPIDQIKTADVKAALMPIWTVKPVVASRTRGRIETVLDYAKSLDLREGDNPARLKGCLEFVLPPLKKSERHHPALPYVEVPDFYRQVCSRSAGAALALRFCILTCTRTTEVIEARWEEIDLQAKVWVIPSHRMKARRQYRVPLTDSAIEVLESLEPKLDGYVFERIEGKSFSNNAILVLIDRMGLKGKCTTHGFRSSFREWAQHKKIDRIAAEMCLDHKVLGKTESAYMRDDLLEQRRMILEQWADYVTASFETTTVIELHRSVSSGTK